MSGTLFSPSWYRVAGLKPRLRAHVEIHRHSYRDAIWFILQDHSSGRSHRLTPAAYAFIGLMDGTRTVQNIWDLCNERTGNDAPTQDDVVRLLGQLHAADALICDVPPEMLRQFAERSDSAKLGAFFEGIASDNDMREADAVRIAWEANLGF